MGGVITLKPNKETAAQIQGRSDIILSLQETARCTGLFQS
ncbi:hypothetical protein MED92_03433 [Oceanospirillum sp. MED92]|uniref:Uncharacterized protein n=1 Tax=Neptuniibacter caesariensis TaxID=207954 RepID=A0A7U8C5J7_NEPCE|nr:hypothetical protein MED92_03433 [Oceanospirillum sp. MED92] [Neptuniibacter caesariensis]